MRIAVILPSRGQIFSQTLECLLANLEGLDYELYWSHGKPIPQCFNQPTEKALKNAKNTHFWFVEEDMVFPKHTLTDMLVLGKPAVAIDYPVSKEGIGSVCKDPAGKVLFTGTGCLLVTRELLEKYKKPIFRSDIAWQIRTTDNGTEITPYKDLKNKYVYGHHDVNFGLLAYLRDEPIYIFKKHLGAQLKLVQQGETGTNAGAHKTELWDKITKSPEFFTLTGMKLEEPKTVNVTLSDGKVALMTLERAKELSKSGKASFKMPGYLTMGDTELTKELI